MKFTLPCGNQVLLNDIKPLTADQLELGISSTMIDDNPMVEPEKQCDCGGYVTYKSLLPDFHSDWCLVNKK